MEREVMVLDHSTVTSHFGSSADRYAKIRGVPSRENFFMQVFEPFAETKLKVLDIGCGTGHRLEGLARYYPIFDLYGIDITPEMIYLAQKSRSKNINFMIGNCLNVSFPETHFQAIIISEVLHHLITDRREEACVLREIALKELVRLMDPDGFIVLHEVCLKDTWRTETIFRLSYLFSRLNISIPALNVHQNVVVNFFTIEELEQTLARLGLAVVKKEIKSYRKLVNWLSGLLSYPYWVTYVLERSHSI